MTATTQEGCKLETERLQERLTSTGLPDTEMTKNLTGGCLNPDHRVLINIGTDHSPHQMGRRRMDRSFSAGPQPLSQQRQAALRWGKGDTLK